MILQFMLEATLLIVTISVWKKKTIAMYSY